MGCSSVPAALRPQVGRHMHKGCVAFVVGCGCAMLAHCAVPTMAVGCVFVCARGTCRWRHRCGRRSEVARASTRHAVLFGLAGQLAALLLAKSWLLMGHRSTLLLPRLPAQKGAESQGTSFPEPDSQQGNQEGASHAGSTLAFWLCSPAIPLLR